MKEFKSSSEFNKYLERRETLQLRSLVFGGILLIISLFICWHQWNIRPTLAYCLIGAALFFSPIGLMIFEFTGYYYLNLFVGLFVAVVIGLPLSLATDDPDANVARVEKQRERENRARTAGNQTFMAQKWVKAVLKDPGSAQFKESRGSCGYVNSKNSFGAYTGYQRYVAIANGIVSLENETKSDTFETLWSEMCR